MLWTNAALQSLFSQYKDRINSISLNNGKYVFIGYESGIQLDDIEFVTFNGVDCLKIHHKAQQGGTVLEWDNLVTTEFIEGIDIMSEGYDQYRLDPLTLK